MILADLVILWFGGVVLIGFVGFFVVVVSLLGRALRGLGRLLAGDDGTAKTSSAGGEYSPRVCEHPHCGYLNRGNARYCARCGSPLNEAE